MFAQLHRLPASLVALPFAALLLAASASSPAFAWDPLPVSEDPLVRLPGTQPGQVSLEGPGRCMNCHADYNPAVEPGHNWQGSMMAQAARDFIYWSCLTVAAQDSIWAVGRPNATDICLRCHFPQGWLEGRSDPTNGTQMSGEDFDGVDCDFCHRLYDPFSEDTHAGVREGADWEGFWDETNDSDTPSQPAADETRQADASENDAISFFNGNPHFGADDQPAAETWTESTSGQYFVAEDSAKRASFADAEARHRMKYSRFHKSKYLCATCHDVSNPVLANLEQDGTPPGDGSTLLVTEELPPHSYMHVERTFSEFMLSDYGQDGGADGLGPFAPEVFDTSLPGDKIGKCQDCHMRDTVGRGCNKRGSPLRPTDSVEHPKSGQPLHDLTGGNAWVSRVLASAVPGSPNHDQVNDDLLNQGPDILTLDMDAGLGIDAEALLDGALRAEEQLEFAAELSVVSDSGGSLTLRVQNRTGHKLISGFPEGRRMFLNVLFYDADGNPLHEINPYDAEAGTLVGLSGYTYHDPDGELPQPRGLGWPETSEEYEDGLVYEAHTSSTLTDEDHTFHFALADGRYKDNRIPPKGFRISEAAARMVEPVHEGAVDPGLFTAAEYAGGYDEVEIAIPAGATSARIELKYQTTSREYIEFLRDEINNTAGRTTLSSPTPSGEPNAYVAQSDPWFSQLKAWGDTIWALWKHNMNEPGAAPIVMTSLEWGEPPLPPCPDLPIPQNVTATPGRKQITVAWDAVDDPQVDGYRVYYDQAGHLQWVADVPVPDTSYLDRGLTGGQEYCYRVSTYTAANCESDPSTPSACATAEGGGGKGRK